MGTKKYWAEQADLVLNGFVRDTDMTTLRFEIKIAADPDRVFSLLAGLHDYGRWLPRSGVFRGTSSISPGPIAVGTTYVETSPFGVRNGRVTAFDPPRQLDFEQPMMLRPALFGTIGIRLFHELAASGDITLVRRRLELDPRGPVSLFMPIVASIFAAENRRMLLKLKVAAEANAGEKPA
jgi:uncharacterized protein YndB with AHSA1/START domain